MARNFLGALKDMFYSATDVADDEDFEDDYDYAEDEGYTDEYEEQEYIDEIPRERTRVTRIQEQDDKVISIHTTAKLEVVIMRPVKFDEVSAIADHLVEKRTVVINLEHTDKNISRRIIDFIGGAAYALKGKLSRIATNTLIITPMNVNLVGAEVVSELENNGVFF